VLGFVVISLCAKKCAPREDRVLTVTLIVTFNPSP